MTSRQRIDKEIVIADATARVTKIDFAANEDSMTYPRSVYTCPRCGKEVSFAMEDFEREALSENTSLSSEDANDIGVASQKYSIKVSGSLNFRSFIDFYCEGCNAAVRIYYDAWAGGRFTHGYHLAFVVEKNRT